MDKPNTLFEESYQMHQKLVDSILEFKGEDGVCRVSQMELARLVDRCQTWVSSAIRRINTEDVCIEQIGFGAYIVHYRDLMEKGVFSEIMKLMMIAFLNPSIVKTPDKEIAEMRGIEVKTVQMFKAYVLSGWKKASSVI